MKLCVVTDLIVHPALMPLDIRVKQLEERQMTQEELLRGLRVKVEAQIEQTAQIKAAFEAIKVEVEALKAESGNASPALVAAVEDMEAILDADDEPTPEPEPEPEV